MISQGTKVLTDVAEVGAGLLDTGGEGLLTLAHPDTGVVELHNSD